ncbi:McrC family protein [Nocardia takedensis]
MRRLTLPEYQSRAFAPIPQPVAGALAATGAVTVAADLAGNTVLRAAARVGVISVGDVELRITPKLGIRRLLWLLGHAANPKGWRDEDIVMLDTTDDIVTALAVSFHAAARTAINRGPVRSYRTVEATLTGMRGRLREAEQMRRRHGLAIPLEVRYDDYTADIAENQILLAAARRLLRVPGLPQATAAGLHRIRTALADVTPLTPGQPIPATTASRPTRQYQPALRLARLVLAERSLDQSPGETGAAGFLFDLSNVFERWLTNALRRALEHHDGELRSQYRSHLDTEQTLPIRPDLVWTRTGLPIAILDAKYKTARSPTEHETDLYQMLAYCTALAVTDGYLVYAAATDQVGPRTVTVRESGTRIHIYALDLTQHPHNIEAQIHQLADTLIHKRKATHRK